MLALTMSAISNTIAPAHFRKALDQTLKKKKNKKLMNYEENRGKKAVFIRNVQKST